MNGIHFFDVAAIVAYLVIVIYLGKRASQHTSDEEGFFLAGRKLGKLYQFFLNFGNATDANGAVSTSSLVYQNGVSGVWLSLQTLFMNPYYWFMNMWFRRVRLVTVADLFEDRFGTKPLAVFYAAFQVVATVIVIIGFGNLVSYKVTSSLLVKPEVEWSPQESASIDGYHELRALTAQVLAGETLSAEVQGRMDDLRDQDKRGELRSYISYLDSTFGKWSYYLVYSLIVGTYIVMGGLAAAAVNEAFQGILIVIFSFLLLPWGLAAIGGWDALSDRVPTDNFQLLTQGGIGFWELIGIFVISIVQIHGIIGNMGVSGSAKNEFAARFGAVSGTYAKRIMIIMWAFVGLIAIALYQGADQLSDPDASWGTMSLQLLSTPFLGLMMAGLLAANMSTIAAQTMAISALFTRNVYRYIYPATTQKGLVFAGRLSIVVILFIGVVAAASMDDLYGVIQLLLTINVPFGAAVVLMFFWRKITAAAVWSAVAIAAVLNIAGPAWIAYAMPVLREIPSLHAQTTDGNGEETGVYFESVVRRDPDDPASGQIGLGRMHIELITLDLFGVPVESMSATNRNAARFLYDGAFPFVVLIAVSLLTRRPRRDLVDRFFGKMKTPVGATPELEAAGIAETRENPSRFNHTKLLGPNSNWEFTKWDKIDAIGFVACLALSFGILAMFWTVLRWASS